MGQFLLASVGLFLAFPLAWSPDPFSIHSFSYIQSFVFKNNGAADILCEINPLPLGDFPTCLIWNLLKMSILY